MKVSALPSASLREIKCGRTDSEMRFSSLFSLSSSFPARRSLSRRSDRNAVNNTLLLSFRRRFRRQISLVTALMRRKPSLSSLTQQLTASVKGPNFCANALPKGKGRFSSERHGSCPFGAVSFVVNVLCFLRAFGLEGFAVLLSPQSILYLFAVSICFWELSGAF